MRDGPCHHSCSKGVPSSSSASPPAPSPLRPASLLRWVLRSAACHLPLPLVSASCPRLCPPVPLAAADCVKVVVALANLHRRRPPCVDELLTNVDAHPSPQLRVGVGPLHVAFCHLWREHPPEGRDLDGLWDHLVKPSFMFNDPEFPIHDRPLQVSHRLAPGWLDDARHRRRALQDRLGPEPFRKFLPCAETCSWLGSKDPPHECGDLPGGRRDEA